MDVLSAAVPTSHQPVITFDTLVKNACRVIRNAESPEISEAGKQELLAILTKTKQSTLSESDKQLYVRTAYGLFLNDPRLNAETLELQNIKQSSAPVVIKEGLMYLQIPQGKYIVLEKLTPTNLEAWKAYADNEYTPYMRLSNFATILEEMDEGPQKASLMWMEFRQDASGINYFLARINKGISTEYDKWIAYVYDDSINTLLTERNSPAVIPPDNIEMVMTVQVSNKHKAYSPMGISRTVASAKKIYKKRQQGIMEAKMEPSLSIWFHALICKMVQEKYKNVDTFWTTPVSPMRKILTRALFPDEILPSLKDNAAVWRNIKEETKNRLAKKILENRFIDFPWASDNEFVGMSMQIRASDLLETILP